MVGEDVDPRIAASTPASPGPPIGEVEEALPASTGEPAAPEQLEKEPGPEINGVLAQLVAGMAYRPQPAATGQPKTPQQLKDEYVEFVVPVLDIVEFQKCLGAVGELPKTARLLIGCAVLGLGLFLFRNPKQAVAHTQPAATKEAKK